MTEEGEHFGLVRPATARTIGAVMALVFCLAMCGAGIAFRVALLRWLVSP